MVSPSSPPGGLRIGTPVLIDRRRGERVEGVVAYVGLVHFASGTDWVGVRLTGPSASRGRNDGSVDGVRYFDTRGGGGGGGDTCGVFVRERNVTRTGLGTPRGSGGGGSPYGPGDRSTPVRRPRQAAATPPRSAPAGGRRPHQRAGGSAPATPPRSATGDGGVGSNYADSPYTLDGVWTPTRRLTVSRGRAASLSATPPTSARKGQRAASRGASVYAIAGSSTTPARRFSQSATPPRSVQRGRKAVHEQGPTLPDLGSATKPSGADPHSPPPPPNPHRTKATRIAADPYAGGTASMEPGTPGERMLLLSPPPDGRAAATLPPLPLPLPPAQAPAPPLLFPHALPASRLGWRHPSLESFELATPRRLQRKRRSYSLVVVTESSRRRILLGLKHRGFGRGLYNSFGGKIEPGETPTEGAVRELLEEANVCVPLEVMERGKVGQLSFTFDEPEDSEMVAHLFRIDLIDDQGGGGAKGDEAEWGLATVCADLSTIRGCDEITPKWFNEWTQIPLDNMFADDSIWMPTLLSAGGRHLRFDGWFHFDKAVEDLTCLHHHLSIRRGGPGGDGTSTRPYTLEQRLFHELHSLSIHSPSIKEFKECWAFASAVSSHYGRQSFDAVVDVAGGHGALAALLLILTSANDAVVIDPAVVGGREGVMRAWGNLLEEKGKGKALRYRDECLRTGLGAELDTLLQGGVDRARILVVACHACQHLSDETIEIATERGVHVSVMPCCQKDTSGGAWKAVARSMGIGIGPLMDLLAAGRAMAPNSGASVGMTYRVKMKLIDEKITPQNRLIMCRACPPGDLPPSARDESHERLQRAYVRAHSNHHQAGGRWGRPVWGRQAQLCAVTAFCGVCAGIALSRLATGRR